MLIYEGTKYDFKMDMDLDKIPHLLEEKLYEHMHIHTSKKRSNLVEKFTSIYVQGIE